MNRGKFSSFSLLDSLTAEDSLLAQETWQSTTPREGFTTSKSLCYAIYVGFIAHSSITYSGTGTKHAGSIISSVT